MLRAHLANQLRGKAKHGHASHEQLVLLQEAELAGDAQGPLTTAKGLLLAPHVCTCPYEQFMTHVLDVRVHLCCEVHHLKSHRETEMYSNTIKIQDLTVGTMQESCLSTSHIRTT